MDRKCPRRTRSVGLLGSHRHRQVPSRLRDMAGCLPQDDQRQMVGRLSRGRDSHLRRLQGLFYASTRLQLIVDRYPVKVETKGSTVELSATRLVFTSNKHPSEWYSGDADRGYRHAPNKRVLRRQRPPHSLRWGGPSSLGRPGVNVLEVKLEVGGNTRTRPRASDSRTDLTRWGLLRLFISHSRPCGVGAAKGKQNSGSAWVDSIGALQLRGSHLCPLNWTDMRKVHSTPTWALVPGGQLSG